MRGTPRTWLTLAALGTLVCAPLAAAQAPPAAPAPPTAAVWPSDAATGVDRTGKGAVMCLWVVYLAAQDVGRGCYDGQDPALQAQLASTVAAIETFMIANATPRPSQQEIDALKASYLEQARSRNLCTANSRRIYQSIRDGGVELLKTATTELLSVPREPVFDPCVG